MRKKTIDDRALRDLEVWFKAWTVTYEQESRIIRLRKAAFDLAHVIVATVPDGADRDAAILRVREAMLLARDAVSNELAHGQA